MKPQLLARRARSVIAVDNSEKMVSFGRDLALRNGLANIEYRLGDLESPPIPDEAVDLAFFSQSLHHALHPKKAVQQARRILRPGGRIVILDLKKHGFEEARELYADLWLGFSEVELEGSSPPPDSSNRKSCRSIARRMRLTSRPCWR